MPLTTPNPVSAPPHILSLLSRLHNESMTQESALGKYYDTTDDFDGVMRDKFIALDQDKSHFLYTITRAINARNVVEVGTSFGVSTIYLALAVGSNVRESGGQGKVIATEKEPSKAAKAREYWSECGEELVERYIELRVGDLNETLKEGLPVVDLVLLDIWAPVALPALKLLEPYMRKGAVVVLDNSVSSAERYEELLKHVRGPGSGYTNLTLPYSGGLDMCVKG